MAHNADFYIYEYLRSRASEHGPVGSPYYVGKGRHGRAFNKAHRVRPPKDKANIIFVAKNLAEDEAFQMEKELIAFYGRVAIGTGCLQNLTDGGEGHAGHSPSAETRIKLSKAVSLAKRGIKQSPEHRAALSKVRKGCTPWNKGKSIPWTKKAYEARGLRCPSES